MRKSAAIRDWANCRGRWVGRFCRDPRFRRSRHSALYLAIAARPRSLKPPRHKARVPALCEINDLPRQPTAPRNAAPKAKVRRGSQPPRFNDRRLPTAPTPRDPPRRVLELPRSTTDPPRSPSKVPRSGLKVPRSIPVLPRRVLEVPRSGFALPRFAAVLGFAFPHPTGLFIPLAAFCRDVWFRTPHPTGVFVPLAAPVQPDIVHYFCRALNTDRAARAVPATSL